MGRSHKRRTTFMIWNPKVKLFQRIAESIPKNSGIHVALHMLVDISSFTFLYKVEKKKI